MHSPLIPDVKASLHLLPGPVVRWLHVLGPFMEASKMGEMCQLAWPSPFQRSCPNNHSASCAKGIQKNKTGTSTKYEGGSVGKLLLETKRAR